MKKNYFSVLVVLIMLMGSVLIQAQDIIVDGDFSSITTEDLEDNASDPQSMNVWTYYVGGGANATPVVENGICKFEISNTSPYVWDIQLIQQGLQFTHGHSYTLSFDVKADNANYDNPRPFRVFLGQVGDWWISFIGHDQFHEATEEWQTITIPFEAFDIFSLHKLSFELGNDSRTIYFDNISIEDHGMAEHSIGIIGGAINDWGNDLDMETTDWVNYSLTNFPLSAGELRFRQDDNWDVNWGGDNFPDGQAIFQFPFNIRIPYTANFNISFNRLTGEYSFECVGDDCPVRIGMVTAFNGWSDFIDMQTHDGDGFGVVYYLQDFYFNSGDVKFKQYDNPEIYWGNVDFPVGTALEDGPGIPVEEGHYNVMFNRETGEYSFEMPRIGILGSALNGWSEDIYLESEDGVIYTLNEQCFKKDNEGNDGQVKFRLNDDWYINWGSEEFPFGTGYQHGPNITVPQGLYNVIFNKLSGEYGFDAINCPSPVIMNLNEEYEPLWPPNHQMVDVYLDYEVVASCPTTTEILISSNEPENGLGDGDHSPDWEVIDDHHVLLRAERSGKGNGREYYITIRVEDCVNFTEEQVIVRVPHSNKKNKRVAFENEANTNGFVLYPNAADNNIYIKGLNTAQNPSYHIYNVYGSLIDRGVLQTNQIDISKLRQGMYIIRLDTNEGKRSKTFIKK